MDILCKLEEIQSTKEASQLCLSFPDKRFFYQKGIIKLTKEEEYWLFHNNPTLQEGDFITIKIMKAQKSTKPSKTKGA